MGRSHWLVLLLVLPGALAFGQDSQPTGPAKPTGTTQSAEKQVSVPERFYEGVTRKPVELKHAWKQGQVFRYRTELTQEMVQTVGGQLLSSTDQAMDSTSEFAVEKVQDGQATLKVTTSSLRQTVKAQGPQGAQTFTIDSEKEQRSGNPILDAVLETVGLSNRLVVDARGKVLAASGGQQIVDRVVRKMPPGQVAQTIQQVLEGMYSDENFAKNSQDSLVDFGEAKTLESGQRWVAERPKEVGILGAVDSVVTTVFLGTVQRDGVECAKLYRHIAIAGVESRRITLQNGQAAQASLAPAESMTAVYVRLSDGLMVLTEPTEVTIENTITLPQGQILTVTKVKTATELVPAPKPAAGAGQAPDSSPGGEQEGEQKD